MIFHLVFVSVFLYTCQRRLRRLFIKMQTLHHRKHIHWCKQKPVKITTLRGQILYLTAIFFQLLLVVSVFFISICLLLKIYLIVCSVCVFFFSSVFFFQIFCLSAFTLTTIIHMKQQHIR